MYLIFALSLIAGLAEGVGILMLLPLLQNLGAVGSAGTATAPVEPGGISAVLKDTFAALGLPDTTAVVLLVITVAFITKGALVPSARAVSISTWADNCCANSRDACSMPTAR